MATVDGLCGLGQLIRLGGGLEEHEQPLRLLYALPHIIDWFEEYLPDLSAQLGDGKQTPMEQLDEMFHDFVSGDDFSFYERSHSMQPSDPGVWELKTADLRLFGWFPHRDVFVIAEIDTAYRCKLYSLYAGYRDSVIRRRDGLDLDEPKFVPGDYSNVL